ATSFVDIEGAWWRSPASTQTLCAFALNGFEREVLNTELTVALIAAGVALVSGGVTIWGQLRTAKVSAQLQQTERQRERKYEAEKIVSRFREPLAQAAFELQGRLYNILRQGLIDVYFDNGTERERAYVVGSTSYLIAQYFGWTEIIRAEIQ